MDNSGAMPLRPGRLFVWYYIGYFLIIRLRDFTLGETLAEHLEEYTDSHLLALKVASGIAFFSYALGQYLFLFYFFKRLRWYTLALAEVVLIFGCMFLRAFLEEGVVKALTGTGNYNPDMSWSTYLIDNLYYAVVFSSIGIIFYFYELARYNEQARQQSELLQRETELKFLRSQVNPHFLFNTLNNLYSLVNANSPQALPALERLSGLLRYSLYEKQQTVPLERELDYLRDLIHLESLRVHQFAAPDLAIGPFSRNWDLPPLLLVPFVENAFKHGDLSRAEDPFTVVVKEVDDQLDLTFTNPIRRNQTSKDEVGGIGLDNVRKRLRLLYPNRHALTIKATETHFKVHLHIRVVTPGKETRPHEARAGEPAIFPAVTIPQ